MKPSRLIAVPTAMLIFLTMLVVPNLAARGPKSLLTTARGQGTLTVGQEVFKVNTVVVKLNEDGTGEITLITDLQLFVKCTWSAPADVTQGIDLKITGGSSAGGAEGSGKLFLRPDGKTIVSLAVEAMSNTRKRKIQLKFVAD